MTREELYTLVVKLLADYPLDDTLFGIYLNIAQAEIEGMRPWRKLLTEDASQSFAPGDSFLSSKTIPANFLYFNSVVLVNLVNNLINCGEVPLESKYSYKDTFGKFYCDYSLNQIFFCGPVTEGYTVHQFYTKQSPLVSEGNVWVFPKIYHPLLALKVAEMWKTQVDYDLISSGQATAQLTAFNKLIEAMTYWDSQLQQNAQSGIDPYGSNSIGQEAGRLPSMQ